MRNLRTTALLLCLLTAPGVALAEDLIVIGKAGFDGVPGADGDPGTPGGPGGPGQSISLDADGPGDNAAVAIGGAGGDGGDGGDGVPAGADGGAGGPGGPGGDATAIADTGSTGTMAHAVASAGLGGAGGSGGAAGGGGSPGADGADGPAGSALAEASVRTFTDATAIAEASNQGSGSVTATAYSEVGAIIGGVPSVASASSDAVAVSTGADAPGQSGAPVVADASTRVVRFLDRIDEVSATAFASDEGAAEVDAVARILMGPLLSASDAPGDVSISAEGHSLGGGDVRVRAGIDARGAAGVPLSVHGAVSGSTAGALSLSQELLALDDVETSLLATNAGGGDLSAFLRAESGFGDVFLGDAHAISDTGADVDLRVRAVGGAGSFTDPSGRAPTQGLPDVSGGITPSTIHASSNGGDVSVFGQFIGGDGGSLPRASGGSAAGDGASVRMVDAISGQTSGNLSLEQVAAGGAGGSIRAPLPVAGGEGGEGWSELGVDTASASLHLKSVARGGRGGFGALGGVVASATGTAIADGVNTAGSVEVRTDAGGGDGTIDAISLTGGRGGAALAEASGRTAGDGHEVTVVGSARGGEGGGFGSIVPGFVFGDGGDASSRSRGVAEGNSLVDVQDRAVGGAGGRFPFFSGSSFGTGGDGGDADSSAEAVGRSLLVRASANAAGGRGGRNTLEDGDGGDALATSLATGLGQVESTATARGGAAGGSLSPGTAGNAAAHARADGASGFALADASSGGNLFAELRMANRVEVASRVAAEARVGFGAAPAGPSAFERPQVGGVMIGAPGAARSAHALSQSPLLGDLFAAEPGARIEAVGEWNAAHALERGGPLVVSSELDITLPRSGQGRDLVLSIFGLSAQEDGFDSLSLRFERMGEAFGSAVQFDTVGEAVAWFGGTLFDFGPALGGGFGVPAVRAIVEVTLGAGDALDFGFAFASVPEPSTGALLALGVAGLAAGRRSRR